MRVKYNVSVCSDCIQAIVNDDFSGLDYYYSPQEAESRENEIRAGIRRLGPNVVPVEDVHHEFSSDPCACCDTHLAGERHGIAVLVT